MVRTGLTIFFVVLVFLPIKTQARERILLEPLTSAEEADAQTTNDYFIRKHTFAAKRYRLVRVNFDALESGGPITIPLFDNEELVVNFRDMKINEFSGGFRWSGNLTQDKITPEIIAEHFPNKDVAQQMFNSMTDIKILVDLLERDKESGANLNLVYSYAEAMSVNKPNRYAERHSNPNNVLGATVSLRTLGPSRADYRIRLLGFGGPYHILWEVDPSRVVGESSNDAIVPGEPLGPNYVNGEIETIEQMGQRETLQQELDAFMASLGENPHDALYLEKMKKNGAGQ